LNPKVHGIPAKRYSTKSGLDGIVPLWPILWVLVAFVAMVTRQFEYVDLVLLFIYGYTLCVASLLLMGHGDGSYGRLFIAAVIIRLVVVLCLEAFPPGSPPSALRYVPGVVFEDETYYISIARQIGQSWTTYLQTN
jgi:hypothetical protein